MQTAGLAKLFALYKPNVPQGNHQSDSYSRGANEMLVRVGVALGIAPEEHIRREFRRLDIEATERSQLFIDRLEDQRVTGRDWG